MDFVGTLIAALAGGAVGGGRYALDLTALGPLPIALITAGGGLALGVGLSGLSPAAGAGAAGAGLGMGVVELLRHFVSAPAKQQTAAIMYDYTPDQSVAYQAYQQQLGQAAAYNQRQLERVHAQYGPYEEQLGRINVNLNR